MTEQTNQQTHVPAENILETEIIINQALIDILIAKRIISEEELLVSIRKIRQEQETFLKGRDNVVPLKSKA